MTTFSLLTNPKIVTKMKQKGSIVHTDRSIIIEIPTSIPATLHSNLMKGITVGLKAHITNDAATQTDASSMYNLAEFLEEIIPGEDQLKRAYRND